MRNLVLALVVGSFALSPVRADQAKERDYQDIVLLTPARPVFVRLHIQLDGKPFTRAWNDIIEKLFKMADADGNGVLDKEEAASVPSARRLFSGGPGVRIIRRSPARGIDADSNNDGKITLKELAGYYQKNGGEPLSIQGGGRSSGAFNLGGSSGSKVSATRLNQALLRLLDANRDDLLDRDELGQAPARLLARDLNEDELIAAVELIGKVESSSSTGYIVATTAMGQSSRMPIPVVMVDGDESIKKLAEQLAARYGAKQAGLGLGDTLFKTLDADANGELDAKELWQFTRRRPDAVINIRFGDGKKITLNKEAAAKSAGIRAWQNGEEVRVEAGTSHLAFGLTDSNNGSRFAFVDSDQINKAQFNAADGDNNGYLDKKETEGSGLFRGLFTAMDQDKDGKVYEKEMLAYYKESRKYRDLAADAGVTLSVADDGQGLFDLLDQDDNGKLTVRELRQANRLIDSIDRNRDGKISAAEIPRRYRLSMKKGKSAGGFGDRVVIFGGINGGFPNIEIKPDEGPAWFSKMDRNQDGDVSVHEFLGSKEVFDKIDSDGDKLLSRAEAQNSDENLRKEK